MKRIHVVSDCKATNGMFVAAMLMARNEGSRVMDCGTFLGLPSVLDMDEVIVHGCWLPCYWRACLKVLKGNCRLVRMTHANLDPVRYRYHGWKKRIVAPIERWLFSKCDRVMVTCEAEKEWCRSWGLKGPFEIVDLKQFFSFGGVARPDSLLDPDLRESSRSPRVDNKPDLSQSTSPKSVVANTVTEAIDDPCDPLKQLSAPRDSSILHVLYLGRPHVLKGTKYLEQAVKELNDHSTTTTSNYNYILRMVSDHTGEELERDWEWCDVLVLPTLSDNFGLVVAEALERGKRVITTDGAPAWGDGVASGQSLVVSQYGGQLLYLKGFREGSDEARVEMLKSALTAPRG